MGLRCGSRRGGREGRGWFGGVAVAAVAAVVVAGLCAGCSWTGTETKRDGADSPPPANPANVDAGGMATEGGYPVGFPKDFLAESPADLTQIADHELIREALEPLDQARMQYGTQVAGRLILRRATKGERLLSAVNAMDGEAISAGFNPYFAGPAGENAADARVGLHTFGAMSFAEIFDDAVRMFPGEYVPPERDKRQKLLDSMNQPALSAIGDRYYVLAKHENLAKIMAEYIRQHPTEFFR